MGAAKRRGTLGQRIAQSVERQKIEDAARHAKYQQEEAERRARIAALPPQERKEAVLVGSGGAHNARLLLALAAGMMAVPSGRVLVVDDARGDIGESDG